MQKTLFALALLAGAVLPAAAQDRREGDPFTWSGDIAKDRWVYVRNLNGAVRIESTTGSKVEVSAVKKWRRGDPSTVKISVQTVGTGKGDVLVCAIFKEKDECDESGYHSSGRDRSWSDWSDRDDVSVEFVVKVPAGVRIDGSTVNGAVEIDGATREVVAHTVNGSVDARSSGGPVDAKTVNGSIRVKTSALADSRTNYETVNGSITVELAGDVNADFDMSTVNGSVESDYPMTIQGKFNPRRMSGTVGKGGAMVRLKTVNGSIRLRKA
jgi:hypothetical protein